MGEAKHDGLAFPGRVVLAHELPFMLGALSVDPPTRQVSLDGRSETLEPRVMEVLVALARANGTIVTREELIDRCWQGRIVGEDAINRVISRLRALSEQLGAGYRVETITKVGYRLVTGFEQPGGELRARKQPLATRRAALTTGLAALATAAGLAAWQKPWRHRPPDEAIELVRRGDLAQRAGFPDQVRQATSYYERAVQIDPRFAAAWGGLALAYTHQLNGYAESEVASLPGRIRSAAGRALELDPDNGDAHLALACIAPPFRNWQRVERDLRRVRDRFPRHWLATGRLAMLLYQVGRLEEGLALHTSVIERIDELLVVPYAAASMALLNLGRFHDSDAMRARAFERWPAHPLLWFIQFYGVLFSGRPGAAAAFVQDPDSLPSGFGPDLVEPRLALARAAQTRSGQDLEQAIAFLRRMALAGPAGIAEAAPLFAFFGRPDLCFACLEGYYFDRGPFAAGPVGPLSRRNTDLLFMLPMAVVRRDPRFARLTRAIGLDGYWRSTGTRPSLPLS